MSNLGRYQDIITEANKSGGPDIWLDTIKQSAYNSGASDMKKALAIPLLLTGICIGTAGALGYKKIKKWIAYKKAEKLLTEIEATQAEKSLKKEVKDATDKLKLITNTNTQQGGN